VKIEGVFLDSRLARRIFSLFVLAVTVPIVLLSVLAYSGWTSYAATQEQQRLTQSTRYFALTVFDRLMAAQSALRMAAPQPADARLHGIFRSVSVEPADASVVPPPQAQRLSWRRPSRDEAPARVTLRVHDPATGLVRIGELAPDYLWSEAFDDAGGEQVCVFAEAGEPIFCSSNAQRAVDEARAGNVVSASWKLFLRHEFGVDDWRFTIQREHAALSGFSWLHIGWQVVAASVLLVITLSLVLVRRTTVPLQKLTAGTRRLAAGDYAARVDVRSADEFGELGAAFNHMARRIGRQVHQLEVLSAIDREILEAGDAQRLVSRTLERLAELSPGAIVGIGLVDPGAPERLACSLRAADGGTDSRELVLTPELQTVLLALPVGRWWSRAQAQSAAAAPLFSALGWRPQACYTAPACWRGQTLAVLLVGEGHAAPHEAWVRRVGELRDRIAVALASAARERQLQHRATHDSLTGMLNRAGLHDVLADAIEAGRRFTLLWIDLDRFKEVNDTLGHAAGDELLATIAQRVVQCVPHGTAVARLGGDEFVALVPDADDAHIDDIAAALVALVARPVMLRGIARSADRREPGHRGLPARSAAASSICCATPTWRCTRPSRAGARRWCASRQRSATPRSSTPRCRASWPAPWSATNCGCTTSRALTHVPAVSVRWKHWCAGSIRRAGSCCPARSSTLPRRAASSSRSDGGCWARRAGRWPPGGAPACR